MCPDRQILSVYLDGELPSPWKEKLEAHLGSCSQCREQLENYRGLSRFLGLPLQSSAEEEAREQVWRRLSQGKGLYRKRSFWSQHVSIPLPAAAAAAAVFIALFTLLLTGLPRQQNGTVLTKSMAAMENTGGQDPVSMSDMNGVLRYLGTQDTGEYVILKLPESRNFRAAGEPVILRAADYPREIP